MDQTHQCIKLPLGGTPSLLFGDEGVASGQIRLAL